MRVAAIVLAAGRGRRVGGPKALLRYRGATFLEHVARLMARPGVDRVVAVLGHDAARVAAAATLPEATTVVVNPRPQQGMLSSLLLGLEAAEADGADAVLVHPVDHPLVEGETIDGVVRALRAGATIAVPSHAGRRGHPGGFARPAWAALRAAPASEGARAVLAGHPGWITHVAAGPGCLAGVDTPESYDRLIGGGGSRGRS